MQEKLFLFIIFGLFIGALLPFIGGRFGKLLPADPGEILLRLFHKRKRPKNKANPRYPLWIKKRKALHLWSLFWAFLTTVLFVCILALIPSQMQMMACIFTVIINLTIIIDAKYWLLPDFFTIPLLVLGFAFSQISPVFTTPMALMGAAAGYLVSVLSVLALAFSPKKELGCGDVKMLTALGAWLGVMGLSVTLIISFVLFILFDLLKLHKKGAYGPALGTAAILVFFLMYMK